MRGRRTPNDVRAQVMAALLAGQAISEVAEQYGVGERTVHDWLAADPEFAPVRTIKNEMMQRRPIGTLVEEYLATLLEGLKRQVEIVSTEEYLSKQPASDVAVLHGVMADKGFRLLAAAAAASGGRGDTSSAPRQIGGSGEDCDPD